MLRNRTLSFSRLKIPLAGLSGFVLVGVMASVAGPEPVATAGMMLAVVAVVGTTILLGLAVFIDEAVEHQTVEMALQVGGIVPLLSLAVTSPLAPLGGSALSPAAAGRLAGVMAQERPRYIVELGSGSSTILLANLRQRLGCTQEIVSIEHDERFVGSVRNHLSATVGNEGVEVVHAPLANRVGGGSWYDQAVLEAALGPQIDLLIVDGPPGVDGEQARSPALSALRPWFVPGSLVFVDDTNRATERQMVIEWLKDDSSLTYVTRGRDHVVLRVE